MCDWLWTESANGRHGISKQEANQRHQCSHREDVQHEDHPYYVLDGEAWQDGKYDGGDQKDAETSLPRKYRSQFSVQNQNFHFLLFLEPQGLVLDSRESPRDFLLGKFSFLYLDHKLLPCYVVNRWKSFPLSAFSCITTSKKTQYQDLLENAWNSFSGLISKFPESYCYAFSPVRYVNVCSLVEVVLDFRNLTFLTICE